MKEIQEKSILVRRVSEGSSYGSQVYFYYSKTASRVPFKDPDLSSIKVIKQRVKELLVMKKLTRPRQCSLKPGSFSVLEELGNKISDFLCPPYTCFNQNRPA